MTGVRSVAAHARGTQPPNRNVPVRSGERRRAGGAVAPRPRSPRASAPGALAPLACRALPAPAVLARARPRRCRTGSPRRARIPAGHAGLPVVRVRHRRRTRRPTDRSPGRTGSPAPTRDARGLRVARAPSGPSSAATASRPGSAGQVPHKWSLGSMRPCPHPSSRPPSDVRPADATPSSPRTSCASARTPA